MLSCVEVVQSFKDWMAELDMATEQADGGTMCESTKMALAFALILLGYYPGALTDEVVNRMKDSFTRALACVTGPEAESNDTDGCRDLYEKNIRARLEKLEHLQLAKK